MTRIPWLRRKIFEPFNDDLLSGAFPALWNKEEYYPKADIFSAKDKREMPIMETLIPFEGQALVEGASGLGKTMFLRKVAEDAPQVMVYLAASDCSEGLIPGIQRKLPIAQHDPDFLQALVYAGAIDILIDGLNEISANACARLTNEIVQHFKGNLIMTTQPMDWEAPASARQYELLPLGEADTREFLATRYPFINRTDAINESAYKKRCEDYLAEAFDSNLDDDTLKANNQILSNPMDLVLVAQLIARGEKPSLLDLQEQQYQVMAKDFKKVNQQADFPLAKFSEVVFQMRLDDKREIPDEEFQAEIKAMDRWKMVVSRIQVNEENREVKKWYFRHDKIMDFFMTQEFLKRKDLIPAHFDDPRFRGVYFLLAFKLEYQQAAQLREELIQHAVDTKDHTLSDAFIELFKRRERPPMEMIKQTQDKVADLVSSGEPVEAIQALKNHVRGELKDELSVLEGRAKKLERVSRVGAVEFEKEKVEFNSISLAVLNLSRRIFQS
ncbi:MAG: hypothetical protein MRZ79_17255 [Bacteroidia bacterium]|nr:hypothetical protein [Bacteroidia bacterium]